MANRRMFSNRVIDRASFLRLAPTTRLLYFDLGMKADDDGFVEAFTVMRTTGAGEDDLRTLESKGFIKIVDDDLLSWIPDWLENNHLRSDRYHPSMHHDILDKLKEANQTATVGIPNGNQAEPEVSLLKETLFQSTSGKSTLDTDRDHDEFFKNRFSVKLKEHLATWYGFKWVTLDELRKLLYAEGIAPEVVCWIAGKAVDHAANSQKGYFWNVVEDKCHEQGCKTLEKLLELEGNEPMEKKRILQEAKKVDGIRAEVEKEWHQEAELPY